MKKTIAAAALTIGAALAAIPNTAAADPTKECVTVEEGKNKNWTVTVTEEQRSACPSEAEHPTDVIVDQDVTNAGGNQPPGQQP